MIRRMKTIASLQELISAKIRSSNSAGKIMAELKEADLLNRLLAFRGLVFSKREDSKVRQFLADFFASEIVSIADGQAEEAGTASNREASARSKLRIEVRKWLMEQYAPGLYGGKQAKQTETAHSLSPKIYLPENGRS